MSSPRQQQPNTENVPSAAAFADTSSSKETLLRRQLDVTASPSYKAMSQDKVVAKGIAQWEDAAPVKSPKQLASPSSVVSAAVQAVANALSPVKAPAAAVADETRASKRSQLSNEVAASEESALAPAAEGVVPAGDVTQELATANPSFLGAATETPRPPVTATTTTTNFRTNPPLRTASLLNAEFPDEDAEDVEFTPASDDEADAVEELDIDDNEVDVAALQAELEELKAQRSRWSSTGNAPAAASSHKSGGRKTATIAEQYVADTDDEDLMNLVDDGAAEEVVVIRRRVSKASKGAGASAGSHRSAPPSMSTAAWVESHLRAADARAAESRWASTRATLASFLYSVMLAVILYFVIFARNPLDIDAATVRGDLRTARATVTQIALVAHDHFGKWLRQFM
ncbi:hypothetical protein H9P43_003439 [Blastocladiella emersonii ATCC 22665]|nr:hypothetical protein H9P43_003439 [Blastocladiella emersonii ATCC 22665]